MLAQIPAKSFIQNYLLGSFYFFGDKQTIRLVAPSAAVSQIICPVWDLNPGINLERVVSLAGLDEQGEKTADYGKRLQNCF